MRGRERSAIRLSWRSKCFPATSFAGVHRKGRHMPPLGVADSAATQMASEALHLNVSSTLLAS